MTNYGTMVNKLDPKPYWVEEAEKRYSRASIFDNDLLWNLAQFKPRSEYSQNEEDYK